MSEIQVGTTTFKDTDFIIAVQDELTCGDCMHCQQNKAVPDRVMGWHCYHPENMQQHLHNKQAMNISDNFLCNKFELFEKTGEI